MPDKCLFFTEIHTFPCRLTAEVLCAFLIMSNNPAQLNYPTFVTLTFLFVLKNLRVCLGIWPQEKGGCFVCILGDDRMKRANVFI